MSRYAARAAENLARLRAEKPLVHNITNFVVMNYTANVLLAAGASPVMAHADNEVEEMVALAGALVLNIGTLTDTWLAAMLTAGRKASELGRPIVLDPVGAGATRLRTDAARRLLAETRVSVVRGNASEILALAGADIKTKGVDATRSVPEAAAAARDLARSLGTTLAVTGKIDLVTDGERTLLVRGRPPAHARGHGHRLLGHGPGRRLPRHRPGPGPGRGHRAGLLRRGRRGGR